MDLATVEETTELMDETLVEESDEITSMIAVEGLNLKPGMAMDVEDEYENDGVRMLDLTRKCGRMFARAGRGLRKGRRGKKPAQKVEKGTISKYLTNFTQL